MDFRLLSFADPKPPYIYVPAVGPYIRLLQSAEDSSWPDAVLLHAYARDGCMGLSGIGVASCAAGNALDIRYR